MLKQMPNHPEPERRRAIILLVVLALLTLFAIVGLAFVFYSHSEASASRIYRESLDLELAVPDIAPSKLLNFSLPQLLFDVRDDNSGVFSAMRGHSLARDMYGENYTWAAGPPPSFTYNGNTQPFNGIGKLHTPSPYGPDDAMLPNYMWFTTDPKLRDPERFGTRSDTSAPPQAFTGGWNTPYTYPDGNHMFLGANRLEVDPASKQLQVQLLVQSFHRPWFFNQGMGANALSAPIGAGSNDWLTQYGKYQIMRPRPMDNGPGFPYPTGTTTVNGQTVVTGDVQCFPGSAGPESLWMDLGYPVQTMWNGQLYKPLFAFFIQDVDGRINVNTHGNVRGVSIGYPVGTAPTPPSGPIGASPHRSGAGWGKWEINLGPIQGTNPPQGVMTQGTNEWTNLFFGDRTVNPVVPGRYGPNGVPESPLTTAPSGNFAHMYAMVDLDCSVDPPTNPPAPGPIGGGAASGPFSLPGGANWVATTHGAFPYFPPGYQNGTNGERTYHPMLYGAMQQGGDDQAFPITDMEDLLLGAKGTGAPGGASLLRQLCPNNLNFADANPLPPGTIPTRQRIASLITTDSYDLDQPGVIPWILDDTAMSGLAMPGGAANATQPPVGPPVGFPPLGSPVPPNPSDTEFNANWQAANQSLINPIDPKVLLPLLTRVDVNRFLSPYPHMGQGTNSTPFSATNPNGYQSTPIAGVGPNSRWDTGYPPPILTQIQNQAAAALTDRQTLANDIYRRLLVVTGVKPVTVNRGNPNNTDIMPRRWLAQLAVNIVDLIDEDEISTPFNFYTPADANGAGGYNQYATSPGLPGNPEALRYWVYGTELPRVVINEVLAEYQSPPSPPVPPTGNVDIKFWVELFSPLGANGGSQNTQQLDSTSAANAVSLYVPGPTPYATYQLDIVRQIWTPAAANGNGNVLGSFDVANLRTQTGPADFATATTIAGGPSTPTLSPQKYMIVGPSPFPDARGSITTPRVPGATQKISSTKLVYSPMQTPTGAWILGGGTDVSADKANGVTVVLRRLVNPHMPFNNTAGASFNPYMTVDYLTGVPLRDATNPALPASPIWRSVGKLQPYAAAPAWVVNQQFPAANGPANSNRTKHTFGRTAGNVTAAGGAPGVPDWLVHLDRQVISPMELLMVSGVHPHQLTHQFMLGTPAAPQKFQQLVPWSNPNNRLYRIFEYLEAHDPAAGITVGGRIPGKININTIYDPEVLQALCDANLNNSFTAGNIYNPGNPSDPATVYGRMMSVRTPSLAQPPGPPPPAPPLPGQYITQNDQPFLGFGIGNYPAGPGEKQFPSRGINNTLLGSAGGNPIFQVPSASNHPYLQTELLRKISNNVTTRSNVFAVWVTVGFFQVTDNSVRPPKMGAELTVGNTNKTVRHQMMVLVDRSNLHLGLFELPKGALTQTAALTQTTAALAPAYLPQKMKIHVQRLANNTANGTPWQIQYQPGPPTVVLLDQGPQQETVVVTADPGGGPAVGADAGGPFFWAEVTKSHAAGVAVTIPGNPGPPPQQPTKNVFNYWSPNYAPVVRFVNIYN